MAIKYYSNPEKRQTIAVLSGTKCDAVNQIYKAMNTVDTGFFVSPRLYKKYLMPDQYKVVVTCDPRDTYDEEIGKQIAKKKLMRNYYKSVDKRIEMFKRDVADFKARWNTSDNF